MRLKTRHDMSSIALFIIQALTVLMLIVTISIIVYIAGGTELAFTHLMYFPIILAAYYFNPLLTLLASVIAGLALGPWMPRNIQTGLEQLPISWIFRLAIFMIIGTTCSLLFQRINRFIQKEIERSNINFVTGHPNMNKLRLDLAELIKKKQSFSLVSFRIKNINSIMQNISYDIGLNTVKMALDILYDMSDGQVYSSYANEFTIVLPGKSVAAASQIGRQFLDKTLDPFMIDKVQVGLLVSGGIVNYPLNASDADTIIRKMGMALDQAPEDMSLCIFDDEMERQSKSQSAMIPLLLNAVKNQEFFLVYQPKKSLKGDPHRSVEALIRWKNPNLGLIDTTRFIKTAEEIGFIGEITKWVIRRVVEQSRQWQEAGMPINIAINVSPIDLANASVIQAFNDIVDDKSIDLSLFELELTERAIMGNRDIVISRFNKLRSEGIKIALDDYGIGYNSMINMVQIPTDYIKIDKAFIDKMSNKDYEMVIMNTINTAHRLGKRVVAEGVEHEEQYLALKRMGCDYMQGYFYARPMLPDDLIAFYKQTEAETSADDPPDDAENRTGEP